MAKKDTRGHWPHEPITTVGELAPQLQQIIESRRQKALAVEDETHAERFRPTRPAARTASEPANVYRSDNLRIDRIEDVYAVSILKPQSDQEIDGVRQYVTDDQRALLLKAGFDDVSDRANGSDWNAPAYQCHKDGVDLAILGVKLDAKGERIGRGR